MNEGGRPRNAAWSLADEPRGFAVVEPTGDGSFYVLHEVTAQPGAFQLVEVDRRHVAQVGEREELGGSEPRRALSTELLRFETSPTTATRAAAIPCHRAFPWTVGLLGRSSTMMTNKMAAARSQKIRPVK
jgi:hypothetical protein